MSLANRFSILYNIRYKIEKYMVIQVLILLEVHVLAEHTVNCQMKNTVPLNAIKSISTKHGKVLNVRTPVFPA